MFHRFGVDVFVDARRTTFRFAQPISILSAIVTAASDRQPVWQVTAEEFRLIEDEGWEVSGSSVQTWPIEEAPPELVEIARQAEDKFLARIREEGPRKVGVTELVYGSPPAGYRSDIGPMPLTPGKYEVHVLAEQGEGAATFEVAAA